MDEVVGPDGVRRVGLDVAGLAPGRARVAGARPEAREPDVELDERAAGVERAELLDPILGSGPGRERGAELRLERVVAGEDPPSLGAAAGLVELDCAAELPRLGVVADPERELERRRSLARLRLRRGGGDRVSISSAESTAAPATTTAASSGERGDDQRLCAHAETRGHPSHET